jgi:hypothetical protein
MALSLREKLQQASQANIATNAAKTLEKLDTMEQPTSPKVVPNPEVVKPTQSPNNKTTRQPSSHPSQAPTNPVDTRQTIPPTQPPTQAPTVPVDDSQDISLNYPIDNPGTSSELWDMLTVTQKRVLRYLMGHPGEIVKYAEISRVEDLPVGTVQTVFKRLKALGVLSSRYGSRGVIKGIRFSLDKKALGGAYHQAYPQGDRTNYPVICPPSNRPTNIPNYPPTHDSAIVLIDRQKNLSISSEVIETTWPNLARCGFGVEQIQQITTNLAAIGKPTDRIILGLDHLEYELANDQLVDKSGQPVADPCSWAFRALAQNGYYRRPKGYVSPEEQALQDAEAEAKSLVDARQRVETARFEAWKAGLSDEAMQEAMKGHPGGPKDAWLRKFWRERGSK